MQIIISYAEIWAGIVNVAGWVFGVITFLVAIILLVTGWENRKTDPGQFWFYVGFCIWSASLLILLNP